MSQSGLKINKDEVLDEDRRAKLRLKVGNVISWRKAYDEDRNQVKRIGSRTIKWPDGSLSSQLGSEISIVYCQNLMPGELTIHSFIHRKSTLFLADRNQNTQEIQVLHKHAMHMQYQHCNQRMEVY